jgi:isocitrate lyase
MTITGPSSAGIARLKARRAWNNLGVGEVVIARTAA